MGYVSLDGVDSIQHKAGNLYLVLPADDAGDPLYAYVVWLVNSNDGDQVAEWTDESPFAFPIPVTAVPIPTDPVYNAIQTDESAREAGGQGTTSIELTGLASALVSTESASSVPLANTSLSFTCEAWYYFETDPGSLFSPVYWGVGPYVCGIYRQQEVAPPNRYWVLTAHNTIFNSPYDNLGVGRWIHVCVSYNANNGNAYFSIDGMLQTTQAVASALAYQEIRDLNCFSLAGPASPTTRTENQVRVDGVRITAGVMRYDPTTTFTPDETFPSFGPAVAVVGTGLFYRIYVEEVDGSLNACTFTEIYMYAAADGSGADLCLGLTSNCHQTGNSAFGTAAQGVVDDTLNQAGSNFAAGTPYIWTVRLAAAVDVQSFRLRAQAAFPERTPRVFQFQKSVNGITWETVIDVPSSAGWASLETRLFTV